MEIAGKKIAIIGAVKSGIASAQLAKKLGAVPFVSDGSPKDKLLHAHQVFEKENIAYEFGEHSAKVYDCDFIVTSPGVPTNSMVLSTAIEKGIKIYSEVEFASWFCKGSIISITGTNGKTTTTALMNHTLNECGIKCFAAGNIGNPFSEIALEVKEDEFVALETSSFQLDFTVKFKPHFSMILNITPDHLDRYDNNFDKYAASKIRIAANQTEEDFFIYNADDTNTFETMKNSRVQKLAFSLKKEIPVGAYHKNGDMCFAWFGKVSKVCSSNDLFIKGEHNIANALAVMAIAKLLNIPNQKIRDAFASFKGVEHRIEFVRELEGVEYYNDSKATNVDSVIVALKTFTKPIYLILGGKDKGNNYDDIKELVKENVKKIYAIGVSAQKVEDYFGAFVQTEKKESLLACVEAARNEAEAGSVLLLSPACASFDMFEDYMHRGNIFKQVVKGLK
ncbi:MAG: UDP-N-acetylmuramoylalanine--D-glutamate ligase [Ignavibacteria bacterium]|nr:MAG: UDP-N-acetylmuramoylalanine--D-glutamate ligase [Ignavibacteria bacterium]KAF0161248.1 MAG: UDP-N-acetylmuramoylalanine--D-glutamate ligase [Ignavibacteria bacterium]